MIVGTYDVINKLIYLYQTLSGEGVELHLSNHLHAPDSIDP